MRGCTDHLRARVAPMLSCGGATAGGPLGRPVGVWALGLLWAGTLHAEPAAGPGDLSRSPAASSPWSLSSPSTVGYWLRLDSDLRVTSETLEDPWPGPARSFERRPDYSLAPDPSASSWGGVSHASGLIELNPTHLLASDPQRDYRPQFSLGSSSDSLRSLLRVAGIEASGCVAPLMRMHSTVVGAGPHTNVSVSARCSIH